MTDVFPADKRSDVMSKIRSKDTMPEINLRKALFALGYRYRCNVASLPGKPDVVLPKYRVVIQVRGCFWHCHNCADGHLPKSRRDYWEPKLLKNTARDLRNDRRLRLLGWHVVVVWECQLASQQKLQQQVRRIVRYLSLGQSEE